MINILEKNVADKIAAGEVIERPVSIVKELVENSIDAGACGITVEIKRGGRELIRVTDDGSGIPADDVPKAFLRHATSKIVKAEDLRSLMTLGFRGEALASVAAVTRTEMITKARGSKLGTRIVIHGGEILTKEPVGCPDGTSLIISDLFYNTPARAKFLKSEAAETSLIIDTVSRIALTKPSIRFTLMSNGRNVFTSNGSGSLSATVIQVFRESDYKELVPFDFKTGSLRIYGLLSRATLTRTNRRSQYYFVNGRVVSSKTLEKGVDAGYKERIFEGRYPIAFIFVETDPKDLDVNIHPNKREVRFDDDVKVTGAVAEAIFAALAEKGAVPKALDNYKVAEPEDDYKTHQVDIKQFLSTKREAKFIEDVNRNEFLSRDSQDNKDNIGCNDEYHEDVYSGPSSYDDGVSVKSAVSLPSGEDFDICEPLNRPFDIDDICIGDIFFGTYISATDDACLYLIDQHAAHERINYEKFVGAYLSSKKTSQLLLTPLSFDIPTEVTDDLWIAELERIGYEIEEFGERTYLIRAIPGRMDMSEAESFVKAFLDAYVDGETIKNKIVIDKLITKACKASIKAHDYISHEEALKLIDELKKCRNPFSCPHGRPTFVRFTQYDLERMFKRIQ